ncbi:MAG: PIN domain-containing protein [Bacteroidales bacterium]|nr:PIN domain-containing protein [Bacteroidales bacterium]
MVIAIDTNIAIDFLNGKKSICEKIYKYNKIYIPVTVLGELLFGVKNSAKKEENIDKLINFVSN